MAGEFNEFFNQIGSSISETVNKPFWNQMILFQQTQIPLN
jgi:hypothetical protein